MTAPTGRTPIGAGDWGGGVILPVSYDIDDRWQLAVTTKAEAAVDQDGDGRHFAYSGILGIGYALNDRTTLVAELSGERDDDPDGAETETLAALSIAWQPGERFQLDALAAIGLNRAAPDLRVLTGGAFLF